MAVGLEQRLVVVQQGQGGLGEGARRRVGGDVVEFAAVLEPAEAIASLAWLAAAPEQPAGEAGLSGRGPVQLGTSCAARYSLGRLG